MAAEKNERVPGGSEANTKPVPPPTIFPVLSKRTIESFALVSFAPTSSLTISPSTLPTQSGSYGLGTMWTFSTAGSCSSCFTCEPACTTISSRLIGASVGTWTVPPTLKRDAAPTSGMVRSSPWRERSRPRRSRSRVR